MADRVLTWTAAKLNGDGNRIGPTYYVEADYQPVAVRVYAEEAPTDRDAEFDILIDGVSMFGDRTVDPGHIAHTAYTYTPATGALLIQTDTEEVDAEDFTDTVVIEEGSWVYCVPKVGTNGKNYSVHLELERISEEDEVQE